MCVVIYRGQKHEFKTYDDAFNFCIDAGLDPDQFIFRKIPKKVKK